jgi:hypothetical protein
MQEIMHSSELAEGGGEEDGLSLRAAVRDSKKKMRP